MRLHLTENEAKFLQTRLRLIAMNEKGQDTWHAEAILDSLTDLQRGRPDPRSSLREQVDFVFADLYPAGGRE